MWLAPVKGVAVVGEVCARVMERLEDRNSSRSPRTSLLLLSSCRMLRLPHRLRLLLLLLLLRRPRVLRLLEVLRQHRLHLQRLVVPLLLRHRWVLRELRWVRR